MQVKNWQPDVWALAEFLHRNYEHFAAKNDWKTQDSCSVDFDKLPEQNQRTMLDLASHLIKTFKIKWDDICVKIKNQEREK